MATNTLIARSELGKPRKTTFTSEHVEPGHVFGLKAPKQAEGAKQGESGSDVKVPAPVGRMQHQTRVEDGYNHRIQAGVFQGCSQSDLKL
jgi:hypothetical protein